ncbi:hypothetical protein EDD21DRAFT_420438 [Dissophora ornata]|nr:hypothetical protein EDD21DRAFT_420438 [Dissophora ornata]
MSSRSMTLRSGKAVAKEGAHAATSVDGAMEAMSIAQDESSQADVNENSGDMEIDEGADQLESHLEDSSLTIESMRERVRSLGVSFGEKNRRKMIWYDRLATKENGGTEAERAQFDTICREAESARERWSMWQAMVKDQEAVEQTRNVAAPAHETDQALTTALSDAAKAAEYESEIKLSPEFPRFHRKVETHLMPRIDSNVSGPVRTNAREFLHEFRKTGIWKFGTKKFSSICYRLLSMANMDEKTADAFVVAHDEDPEGVWDWDRCEQTFVDSALTALEKAAEVDEFAKAGREKTESYKEFSYRLKRLIEVYKAQELPKHADVTQTLRMTVPSHTLSLMELHLKVDALFEATGIKTPSTTSLDAFVKALPTVYGPDECTEWKTFIDAARKTRVSKEAENAKIAQQAKEKQHQHQRRAAVQTTAAGTVSTNATSTQQQASNAFQGNRGGGRGFFN